MDKVHFTIHRKLKVSCAVLSDNIYINGVKAGRLKNGGTLRVSVPRADIYLITTEQFFENNALIRDNGGDLYRVQVAYGGNWKDTYTVEFTADDTKLPAVRFDMYYGAALDGSFDKRLSEAEKTVGLCMDFWVDLTESADEVLASENIFDKLDALKRIGAEGYYALFRNVIDKVFDRITLPIDDRRWDGDTDKRMAAANKMVWAAENETDVKDGFRSAMARYVLKNIKDLKFVE